MLFLKSVIYLFLVITNVVDITSKEQSCHCMSLPAEFMKHESVFCEFSGTKSKDVECGRFIHELKKCYNCLNEWRENRFPFSIVRIWVSVILLVNGWYFPSILVLLTRNIPIKDVMNLVEKKLN